MQKVHNFLRCTNGPKSTKRQQWGICTFFRAVPKIGAKFTLQFLQNKWSLSFARRYAFSTTQTAQLHALPTWNTSKMCRFVCQRQFAPKRNGPDCTHRQQWGKRLFRQYFCNKNAKNRRKTCKNTCQTLQIGI